MGYETTLEERLEEYEKKMTLRLPSDRDHRKALFPPATLKAWRLRLRYTQKQMATCCEVSTTAYRSWEAGNATPTDKQKRLLLAMRDRSECLPPTVTAEDVKMIRLASLQTLETLAEYHKTTARTWNRWENGQTPGPRHQALLSESLQLAKIILEKE